MCFQEFKHGADRFNLLGSAQAAAGFFVALFAGVYKFHQKSAHVFDFEAFILKFPNLAILQSWEFRRCCTRFHPATIYTILGDFPLCSGLHSKANGVETSRSFSLPVGVPDKPEKQRISQYLALLKGVTGGT